MYVQGLDINMIQPEM
ncbi:unnamed protein product [Clonostachys rosea f. rosea IK726]|uniref:Uncharacterized protein n=1 Tax=Clonostachys rosea f. rosea IK726 TaxID=1349383 RepID=A0ACA9USV6_BIOOC|nr:unnamed protein product [Clonostachys rosea f. rosea IK726]